MFGVHSARRRAISASSTSRLTERALRSTRRRSLVFSNARPPPTAASGDMLRIEGLADVPLWRPSPRQGRESMPCLISAAGGAMFTTSALPG
ncbi:hypothetical protein D3C84_932340 [compost metagenome]